MQCLGKKGKSKIRSMKERARDSEDSKDWGRLVKAWEWFFTGMLITLVKRTVKFQNIGQILVWPSVKWHAEAKYISSQVICC